MGIHVPSSLRRSALGIRRCTFALILSLVAAALCPAQPLFWLQTDGGESRLGSARNPQLTLAAGDTVPLYLWLSKTGVSYGFDAISFDVRLVSSDAGSASVWVQFDEPAGRWSGTTGGTTRNDSGGTGVRNANAIDLTNTDTLEAGPLRLATLHITATAPGHVQLFLCTSDSGMVDGGSNVVVRLGLAAGSTAPDAQLINGGIPGLCSTVPEASITIARPPLGDFDGDGDVDQDDFGYLQRCLSGPLPQTDPACAEALLNGDPFVDELDVALFLQCLSGSSIPPPAACR